MTPELTLYSRITCDLCEDMEALLRHYLKEVSVVLNLVYIDDDRQLEQDYGSIVPVLKAGKKEICHYFLDLKALQQYMSGTGNPLK